MALNRETETISYEDGGHAEIQMLDGQNDGWWTVYQADGSKKWERHYKNGQQCGPERAWFASGAIEHEWTYADGELHGPWKTWHENAQLKNDTFFKTGDKDLFDRWYDTEGQLVAEEFIRDGVRDRTSIADIYNEDTGEETPAIVTYNDGQYAGYEPLSAASADCFRSSDE